MNTTEVVRTPPEGSPLPIGIYSGVVTRTAQKQTNDKTGVYIEVEFDITGPAEFANRKFWDRFNIMNKSTEAVRIATEALSDLGIAAGLPVLTDDEELIGREVLLDIKVDPAKPYVDKSGVQQPGKPGNSCRKYWPLGTDIEALKKAQKGAAPAAATRPAAPTRPAWGAQAAAHNNTAIDPKPVHTAPLQAAPATNVAPWKRNKA